jgi:RNA polymerase sigma factor (sigma-70 family)
MHRIINETPKGKHTDHINHDSLDNRKCNLRTCSNTENSWNQRVPKNNTSGYKGVSWDNINNTWIASIGINGKSRVLGRYDNKEDAAMAYDCAAIENYGEFACLNQVHYKPETLPQSTMGGYYNNYLLRNKARELKKDLTLTVIDVISKLTSRESEIIKLRYGIDDGYACSLREVGRIFKVTRERVRQIEAKAMRKLKTAI